MPKSKLSLIIPAYNEEKTIAKTVEEYSSAIQKKFSDYEIILVVNNCSDSTPEIVSRLASKNKKIVSVIVNHYTGKGGAVRIGLEKAKGEIMGFVDADNSTKVGDFLMLAEECEKRGGITIGSRAMKDSVLVKKQPFARQLLGKAFSAIVELLFSLNIKDTQCGAKVFTKSTVKLFLKQPAMNGFAFDVQLLWIAKRNGIPIKEIGVKWENNEDSKVGFFEPLRMLLGLVKLRFWR